MKQFIEFVPVVLFVAVYFTTKDIYLSTAMLMAGIFLQVAYEYFTTGKVEKKTQIIFAIAMLFGGATLLFRNEVFIQWKPTIVNWLFAVALWGSLLFVKTNLLKKMIGEQLSMPDKAWKHLNNGWALGFFIAGVLNLVVAYNFSLDFWVSYKLFGGMGLTIFYMVCTVLYLMKGGYLSEAGDPDASSAAALGPNDTDTAKPAFSKDITDN
jgi:intracellular septation protein